MSETNVFRVNNAGERTALLRSNRFQGRLSPDYCPRGCGKTIDKPNRRCRVCGGIVQFGRVDDGKYAESQNLYPYVWTKNIWTGITGWHPFDFFINNSLGEITK